MVRAKANGVLRMVIPVFVLQARGRAAPQAAKAGCGCGDGVEAEMAAAAAGTFKIVPLMSWVEGWMLLMGHGE
ncbi:hypothetical protein GCM10027321_11940 [Massilia terrae]